ncbi:MAG: PEP/pyruvate-binding domain-containing protein [Bacteroidales bacterium]|nr:PEP/pyruvate-binding domain-containing protein [Bacteroidales bacterium]
MKTVFRETSFEVLMQKRVQQVLLICSKYDAFIMEEDGKIDEKVFNDYVSFNLRYPPKFIHVTSAKEALETLADRQVDLIINMLSICDMDPFELSLKIKSNWPDKPIVILAPVSREIAMRLDSEEMACIDYVFNWLGSTNILLPIISLIEDKMNVDEDALHEGVQSILLFESSVRLASVCLRQLYRIILEQSHEYMIEGLNEHQKMMQMRGRPKILLATNSDDAINLFEKHKPELLGIIGGLDIYRNGIRTDSTTEDFFRQVRDIDHDIPVIIHSSASDNEKSAGDYSTALLSDNAICLPTEMKTVLRRYFSFGDFVFIDPGTGEEIARISDLQNFQRMIFEIPDDSLRYHLSKNHLSKWLYARALFSLAEFMKEVSLDDFASLDQARRFFFDTIANFRRNKGHGIIADFYREHFDEYLTFTRIGDGSMGGKARGLAFLDYLIKENRYFESFSDTVVSIPRTVVLSTDLFDEFMETNNLYGTGLSDKSDREILNAFINARLPARINKDLFVFISIINGPVAIRSSSLLEDSHFQPFAGVYSTYMIPKPDDERIMLDLLSTGIKSVYASVFFKGSKDYMKATANVIEEEKMGIVLQEVCGQPYGNRFYPTISGVARSINFYPIEPEQSEDGFVSLAFGLGKYIVDGGISLRFSPKYPRKILQLSDTKMALSETQQEFYALDLNPASFVPSTDDSVNLLKLKVSDAENDGSLIFTASTYDYQDDMLRDEPIEGGRKVITFANILKYDLFPLADILKTILELGQKQLNNPVEIEFAANIDPEKKKPVSFNLLQIRPIVENYETIKFRLEEIPQQETVVVSHSALGNGTVKGICEVVYVRTENFEASKNPEIASRLNVINDTFLKDEKNYILIGPGRWGSSDPWRGIPIKWQQISAARVIVESGLENYRIDPSQGTHFFQNLTAFRVGYFTVNPFIGDGFIDYGFLSEAETVYEDDLLRHVRFRQPLTVMIDGKKKSGVIMKPESDKS